MNELIFLFYLVTLTLFTICSLMIGRYTLTSLVALEWVLANLFVTKQITLFGWNATASDALAVGAILGLNLVQEEYGQDAARRTIASSFLCLLFYTAVCMLHLHYIPSLYDVSQQHFLALLSPMPRLIIASLITTLVVQYTDYQLYSLLAHVCKKRFFVLRNYISISITQAIDTILFSILGLYGLVDHLYQIMFISYVIKLCTLLFAAPFLAIARRVAYMLTHHTD